MNELELSKEKVIATTFAGYSTTPIDYVFAIGEDYELKKALKKLKYFSLEKKGFFILVQPYYYLATEYKKLYGKTGYVYFIKNKNNGFIKVGRTNNPQSRLSQLKTTIESLELLYAVKVCDCYKAESELHKLYKNKNIYREWFKLLEEDIQNGLYYLTKKHNVKINNSVAEA